MSKKTPWQIYKEKNGVTPLDIFKPNTKESDPDVANKRYEICLQCPELIDLTKQCKKCGCFMNIKTKYEAARCPIGKW